jgi:DNA-binding IscR family transcriptional regulator
MATNTQFSIAVHLMIALGSSCEQQATVDAPQTFAIHDYPVQSKCLVSCNIERTMNKVSQKAQNSFEGSLEKTSLAEVIADVKI